MRRVLIFILFLTGAIAASADKKPVTTEALQAQVEKLKASADVSTGERCAEVCLEAAKQLTELSNRNFTEGNVAAAQTNMADAGKYAEKAAHESMQSRKRQKKTEIGLRKLTQRMDDIMKSLDVDDRPAVKKIMGDVDKARTDLLSSMFGNPPTSLQRPTKEKK